MENRKSFDDLEKLWARVEAARPKLDGSAPLMPRKKPRGHPLKPFPPYGKRDATSSASRG